MQPLWTRNFTLLTIVNFLLFNSFYLLLPTLPVYITYLGANEAMVGLVNGVFTIAAVSIRPWSGMYFDKGNRRPLYLGAMLLFILCILGYYWAATVTLLLFLRLVHGFAWGVVTTAGGALAADYIPPQRRGEGMGFYGMSVNLAMTIAPAIGLSIIATQSQGTFSNLFMTSAAVAIVALLLILLLEIPKAHGHGQPAQEQGWRRFFEENALSLGWVMFLTALVYGGVMSFISLYSQTVAQGLIPLPPALEKMTRTGALFFTTLSIVLLVTRPTVGRLFDRRGPKVLIPGFLAIIVAVLLLGLLPTFEGYFLAAVLMGFGFGSVQPGLMAMAINRVAPRRRGVANATVMSGMDLGIGIGSLVLGAVAQGVGYQRMYLFSVLAAVLALVWFASRETKEPVVEEKQQP